MHVEAVDVDTLEMYVDVATLDVGLVEATEALVDNVIVDV